MLFIILFSLLAFSLHMALDIRLLGWEKSLLHKSLVDLGKVPMFRHFGKPKHVTINDMGTSPPYSSVSDTFADDKRRITILRQKSPLFTLVSAIVLLTSLAIVFSLRKPPESRIVSSVELPGAAEFLREKPLHVEASISVMGDEEPKRSYSRQKETLRFPDRSSEECPVLDLPFEPGSGDWSSKNEINRLLAKNLASLIMEARNQEGRLEIEIHVAPMESETEDHARMLAERHAETVWRLLATAVPDDTVKLPLVIPMGSIFFGDVANAQKVPQERKVIALLIKRWKASAK